VRKRNIGDFDHAVLSTRALGHRQQRAFARLRGRHLLSNLLGNGASFTPRWGLVTPEEIARVDVLYGPFSAAFPGNSVGAVVDYITRNARSVRGPRANRCVHAALQPLQHRRALLRQPVERLARRSPGAGSRGGWARNRLDNEGQPLTFATKVVATGTPGNSGTPVTGAVFGQNPAQPGPVDPRHGHADADHAGSREGQARLRFLARGARELHARVLAQRRVPRRRDLPADATGAPVFSGNVNIAGRTYSIAPTELAQNRADLEHLIHGLSLKSHSTGGWGWEAAASLYDYQKDIVRSPIVALPAADSGGAGRITDQDGTGWMTLALKGVWRPRDSRARTWSTSACSTTTTSCARWCRTHPTGFRDSPSRASRPSAAIPASPSAYAQDTWRFAPDWRATLGPGSSNGRHSTARSPGRPTTLAFGERNETSWSPKAAIAWQWSSDWVIKASLGRGGAQPHGGGALPGLHRLQRHRQQRSDLKPEKVVDERAERRARLRSRDRCAPRSSSRTPRMRSTRRPT
jgi:iron complex outermembrane receptor protein